MTKGQRIRKAREKAHFSQTDLAKKIGISKQTLYKYEPINILTKIRIKSGFQASQAAILRSFFQKIK